VILGVLGALLLWAQGCYTRFTDAVTAATVEGGEAKDATIIVRDKFSTTLGYYQQAKEILDAMLQQYKPDEHLMASYRIGKRTPQTYLALTEAIDAFEKTHNRLVVELDERVIAQAIIDQLVIYRDDFFAAMVAAGAEDTETDDAYALQHSYFDEDTIKLRLIHKIACMIWGDDSPKLKDLGFVPSSEVWTPGEPGTGTAWDAKPIAKIMKAPYPLNGISAGCEEYFGTTRFDFRIAWAPKGEGVPPMPEEDYMTDVEQPTLLDVELMIGYVYYEWIRARKDGEVSEWSDVASYEWEG